MKQPSEGHGGNTLSTLTSGSSDVTLCSPASTVNLMPIPTSPFAGAVPMPRRRTTTWRRGTPTAAGEAAEPAETLS
jgi:hypothetical protein